MIHTGESQKKYDENRQKVERGNAEKYKEKLATQQKLCV